MGRPVEAAADHRSDTPVFFAMIPAGALPGKTFVAESPKGEYVEVVVPTQIPEDRKVPVLASQCPFSWENYGMLPPPVPPPWAGTARRCSECEGVISRLGRSTLCTMCITERGAQGREELPPVGEGRSDGASKQGARVCPCCRATVAIAGYSWMHHMSSCDPVYFRNELERCSLSSLDTRPELRCLRPERAYGGDDQVAASSELVPAVPFFDRRSRRHTHSTEGVAEHRLFCAEKSREPEPRAGGQGWEVDQWATENAVNRFNFNQDCWYQFTSEEPHELEVADEQQERGERLKQLGEWAGSFLEQQQVEIAAMRAEHAMRMSRSRQRHAVIVPPEPRRGEGFARPREEFPDDEPEYPSESPTAGMRNSLLDPSKMAVNRSSMVTPSPHARVAGTLQVACGSHRGGELVYRARGVRRQTVSTRWFARSAARATTTSICFYAVTGRGR